MDVYLYKYKYIDIQIYQYKQIYTLHYSSFLKNTHSKKIINCLIIDDNDDNMVFFYLVYHNCINGLNKK